MCAPALQADWNMCGMHPLDLDLGQSIPLGLTGLNLPVSG